MVFTEGLSRGFTLKTLISGLLAGMSDIAADINTFSKYCQQLQLHSQHAFSSTKNLGRQDVNMKIWHPETKDP